MKVEYKDDSLSGAGNGILVITESGMADGPWSLSIQRASDRKFLTGNAAGQWTGEKFFMSLPPEKWSDGSLAFALGPEIVDSLDAQEQYRVTLKNAAGETEQARLKPGVITYSPGGNVDNTGRQKSQAKSTPRPEPKPAPVAEAVEKPLKAEAAEKPLEMTPPKSEEPEVEVKDSRKKSRLAMLVIALLAAMCLAWWYLDKRREDAPVAPPAKSAQQEKKTETPAAAQSAEERVRQFFKGQNPTPQAALELAGQIGSSPASQDAVYRLYYFAAGKNDPAALLLYGACIDPSLPKWGTINKDGREAWDTYKKALQAEPEKARAAMDNLRAWLEKEAAAGNAQAKTWLAETAR